MPFSGWDRGCVVGYTPDMSQDDRGSFPVRSWAVVRGPAGAAAEADKERAAAVLERACGDGRLSLDEFGERVGAVWAAESVDDLDRATAGVPAPAPGAPVERRVVAVFGVQRRAGHWRVPRRLTVVAVAGRARIDLRDAVLDGEHARDGAVLEIDVLAVLGSVRIVVPRGVEVVMGGRSLAGWRTVRFPGPDRRGRALATVRVTGHVALGSVKVRGLRF
jgi:Domain of unknown function (DUF1707)